MNKLPAHPKWFCLACHHSLDDYAIVCPGCGLDLIQNDPLSPNVRNKSINRHDYTAFFYVSPLKLVVMSITTFGIYQLFWFYKNWTYVHDHTSKKFWPGLCAIFSQFTYYGLIKEIAKAGELRGVPCKLSALKLALVFFVLQFSGLIPVLGSVIVMTAALPLVPAQQYINRLNAGGPAAINSRFTPANWVAIVIGSSVLLLSIVGSLFRFSTRFR